MLAKGDLKYRAIERCLLYTSGGGSNHRYNLSTAVMLKDNHIDAAGGGTRAIEMARAHADVYKRQIRVIAVRLSCHILMINHIRLWIAFPITVMRRVRR